MIEYLVLNDSSAALPHRRRRVIQAYLSWSRSSFLSKPGSCNNSLIQEVSLSVNSSYTICEGSSGNSSCTTCEGFSAVGGGVDPIVMLVPKLVVSSYLEIDVDVLVLTTTATFSLIIIS